MVRKHLLPPDHDGVALIDTGTQESITYAALRTRVSRRAEALSSLTGDIVFLGAATGVPTVVDYLALTEIGATVAMLDPSTPSDSLNRWTAAYEPAAWWGFDHRPETRSGSERMTPREEAALLPTSGSTGNPRFVRLSMDNLMVNAQQIRDALRISPIERALAHLPLYYSYGLSVLNSHLIAGATLVLCRDAAVRPEFWRAMHEYKVTSVSGVPYHYEIFIRTGLLSLDLPDLRHLTQAGGRMPADRITQVHEAMSPRGVDLWIMYGQTEATARISVLPPEDLDGGLGSVGMAVPGGTLGIDTSQCQDVGEVVFTGPNVMLGYAAGLSDLEQGDLQHGVLRTGDVGRLDANGRLWVTGRLKRIAKVFGTRMNLDDLEVQLGPFGRVAIIEDSDRLAVFVEAGRAPIDLARRMERAMRLPYGSIRVHLVAALPTMASGKIDHHQLRAG